MRWAADGHSLFLASSKDTFPARVYRLDLTTGQREVWKEFMPGDPTGITSIGPNAISADGKTILFGYSHTLSDLYIAEGLRGLVTAADRSARSRSPRRPTARNTRGPGRR